VDVQAGDVEARLDPQLPEEVQDVLRGVPEGPRHEADPLVAELGDGPGTGLVAVADAHGETGAVESEP
jgi:hypothetical protein